MRTLAHLVLPIVLAVQVCAGSQQDYDYRSLAIASILTSAQEASKLPDTEARVSLVITATKLLPESHRSEAIALLEHCLQAVKDNHLRNELLAAYARLDPERALALQETEQDEETPGDEHKFLRAGGKWSTEILARRGPSNQAAGLALSVIDANPEQAFSLVVQSVKEGIVSNSVNALFDKLQQKTDRALLDRFQLAVAQTLANTMTLDSFSLSYAASLLNDDRMPNAAKRGLIQFLMNSTEMWVALVKGDDGKGGLDASYVSSSFTRLTLNVRPAITKHSLADTLKFDLLLDQASKFVPEKTKSTLQVFQPETLREPRERLNVILKDPSAERRDLRLIGLASELLRQPDINDVGLATDTVSHFSDTTLRSAFGDFLLTRRVNSLVQVKQFIEAKEIVSSISSSETRVWAMLALAVAAKSDKVLAFELISDAMEMIDAASASPAKVALALMASALLVEDSPERSFEILAAAAKYSNSAKALPEKQNDAASALGLRTSIGNLSMVIAREPKSLAEVKIDPRVGLLAKKDWFRSQQLADNLADPTLRLALKLQFAGGVLSHQSVK